jgi:hypothetical protein
MLTMQQKQTIGRSGVPRLEAGVRCGTHEALPEARCWNSTDDLTIHTDWTKIGRL